MHLPVRMRRSVRAVTLLLFLTAGAHAQGPAFQSPGTPSGSSMGQTTRFSNEFNPAIGAVLDAVGDYRDDDVKDGLDGSLRAFELNAAAYVDPEAWAYVVLVSEDGESPTVEEAAVEYTGMSGNQTLRAGRFFVDFGKQMQQHREELRTVERPLPLREFLGDELAGFGVQYDNWFAANDATPVRFSLGVFSSLAGEGHAHGDDDDADLAPEAFVADRKDVDELSFSARLTGMTDVGATGLVQLGTSARFVPEFAFEGAGLARDGLSNTVFGVDATYSRTDETGEKRLLVGGEFLRFDGDLAARYDDAALPTAIQVVDDTANGFFVFGDYAWDRFHSAGVQYASADLAEDPSSDASELDLYYTNHLTEMRRLRFGVTFADEAGEDSTRFVVQFTNFFGNHSHGLNW